MKPKGWRDTAREKARGAAWFKTLDNVARGDLGDEFVLDLFDWRDWFETKPSSAFLAGADEARMHWEMTS